MRSDPQADIERADRPSEDAAIAQATALLRDAFAAAERAVIFTGAGISTESGIPDFRSPGGIWSRMRPIEFADFLASEDVRLEDWRRRFRMAAEFAEAAPNAGHHAVARLVADGKVAGIVTQNIDGLHQRAGAPEDRVVEVHGNGMRAACLDCAAPMSLDAAAADIAATGRAPRCPHCGGLVKASIISFGQPMPEAEMARAKALGRECDLYLVAGSSLVVHPAAGLPMLAKRNGARLVILNREPTPLDGVADLVLRVPIGATLGPLAQVVE